MKKRIIAILLLSFTMISFVIPFDVENKNIKKAYSVTQMESIIMKDDPHQYLRYDFLSKQKNLNVRWTTTNIEVKEDSSIKSEIPEFISDIEYSYIEYKIPENTGFKSYMSYKAVTSKKSDQFKLQSNYAYTGDYGIRQVNKRYCIAVGTAFDAEIGDFADLILENGEVIPTVISDIKDDKDTQDNNIVTVYNGCVSEFIVDISVLKEDVRIKGDVSYCKNEWDSPVIKIKIYEKNVFEG